MSLQDCKVVIIGGSSPIGKAIARAVLREGGKLALAGRSVDRLGDVVDELGGDVDCCEVDVRDERGVGYCLEKFAPFNHLILTVAEHHDMPFLDADLSLARQMFEVKFWGQLSAAQEAVIHLNEKGSITFFSGHSVHPTAGACVSDAINGAVEAMVRSLSVELHPIRVNAISPGDDTAGEVAEVTIQVLTNLSLTGQVVRPDGQYHTF